MLTTPNTDNAEHATGLQRGIAFKAMSQESRTLAHITLPRARRFACQNDMRAG